MSFDREEFNALAEKKRTEALNGQHQNLRMIAQAEVKMGLLTGDPCWDTFLSYLEAAVETTERQLALLQAKLFQPEIVDTNEIMGLKVMIAQCQSRAEVLRAVMSLPKDIKTTGEVAKELLDRLNAGG